MTKFFALVAGIALVVVLGFVIDAQSRVPVVRQEIPAGEYGIYAAGRIEGTSPEIELRPQLAGRVEEVLVEEGQFVTRGQPLLRLDAQEYTHEVALAEAQLALAQAQLERLVNGARPQEISEAEALHRAKAAELDLAHRALERTSKLHATQSTTQQRLDEDRIRVETLSSELAAARARVDLLKAGARQDEVRIEQARVRSARARLDLARLQNDRAELRAPCDGQILEVDAAIGELTGPDAQQPVVVLADTSSTHVRAFVEELDAPRVEVGMSASVVTDGMPGCEFRGRVYRVSPRMQRKELWSDRPSERFDTKTREVWIALEEEEEPLVVGLRVDVLIDPRSGPSAEPEGPRDEAGRSPPDPAPESAS